MDIHQANPNAASLVRPQIDRLQEPARARDPQAGRPAGVLRPAEGAPQGGPAGSNDINAVLIDEPQATAIASAAEHAAGLGEGAAAQQDDSGPQDPLSELMNQWGGPSKEHDYNSDGTVNVFDLLELLSRMNTTETDGSSGNNDSAGSGPDNDGTIHVGGAEARSADAAAAATTDLPAVADGQAADQGEASDEQTDPMSLKGLLDAWGSDNAQYDLNSDGTVNVFDLLNMLAKSSPQSGESSANIDPSPLRAASGTSPQPVKTVSDRLFDELFASGFKQRPPSNLSDVIDKLNLSQEQRGEVHSRVLSKYPKGAALNLTG